MPGNWASAGRKCSFGSAAREPALTEVMQTLDTVTGTGQERFAGWLLCLGARALGDLAERARARQDPAAAAERPPARQAAGRTNDRDDA